MNLTFSSSSISNDDDNKRLKQREQVTFNRFSSLQEQTLIAVENHRHSISESTSNLLIEDKDNLNDIFSYDCTQCLKVFASEYGLNYHINMSHSNQSILCSDCQTTFRSHRALKTHQQRFHFNYSQKLPNYTYLSSYLNVAFSTRQFSLIAKNACEQRRLPLGELSSKFFSCETCHLAFPCTKALKYHLLNEHEQYEYKLCTTILHEIIGQVEENLHTVRDDNEDIESIKFLLSKQASHFGLVNKQLARDIRCIKHEHNHRIFPLCQHPNRTCANLCFKYVSSYYKLIENYSYTIPTVPKGNPFAQGSIVSRPINGLSINPSVTSKDGLNSNSKHTSLKRVKSTILDHSLSPQPKRKVVEQPSKTTETKPLFNEQVSISPKKLSSKSNHSYPRSLSSMSSNSSASTRTSVKKSRQTTITSFKRSVSPTMTLAVERSSEKRRRQREQRKAKASQSSSDTILKTDDDIEQENGDDSNDYMVSTEYEKSKRQRQASNSSVEYVQVITNDQQTISSLNNIENLKLNSKNDEKDVIVCHSPPSVKKVISSTNKTLSKSPINGHQTADYDEHVRVRCKICGDILEGRSRFSKHVLTMHSHLLKSNITDIKQQQTTVVR